MDVCDLNREMFVGFCFYVKSQHVQCVSAVAELILSFLMCYYEKCFRIETIRYDVMAHVRYSLWYMHGFLVCLGKNAFFHR